MELLIATIATIMVAMGNPQAPPVAQGQDGQDTSNDSLPDNKETMVHRLELDIKPGAIIHTSDYLKGANPEARTMNHALSAHLKYAFAFPSDSYEAKTYGDVYQGVGLAYNDFNPQLGYPISAYIFQGARIARFSKSLALNYEWNLGLAMGWKPYDEVDNPDNTLIGSKVTAYIGLECYLNWRLSNSLDLNIGGSIAHYSNGNTQLPNFGLNVGAVKASLAYYINRKEKNEATPAYNNEKFAHQWNYDLILYGAWRQRGMMYDQHDIYILPKKYPVVGFSFSPLYRLNPWLKIGGALDGVYDGSAYPHIDNNYATSPYDDFHSESSSRFAMGASARIEFTMPYFAINVGVGKNFINGNDYFGGIYETLALKLNVSRRFLIHIGYGLHDFDSPNHLMLGFGWRFGK